MIAWVIFRSNSLQEAFAYIYSMIPGGGKALAGTTAVYYLKNAGSVLIISAVCSLPIYPRLKEKFADSKIAMLENILVVLIFILALIKTISSNYNPFIYFNF